MTDSMHDEGGIYLTEGRYRAEVLRRDKAIYIEVYEVYGVHTYVGTYVAHVQPSFSALRHVFGLQRDHTYYLRYLPRYLPGRYQSPLFSLAALVTTVTVRDI
jgi:hypothetical protein